MAFSPGHFSAEWALLLRGQKVRSTAWMVLSRVIRAWPRCGRIARHDLARLNYPPANWVPERAGPDGKRVLDVLVVGAGMCGQTVGL